MISTIKLKILLVSILVGLCTNSLAIGNQKSEDNQKLLNKFHQYGITHCDNFILKESSLKANKYYLISQHPNFIDKNVKEVGLVQISGTKGDTIKSDDTFIQTPNACFVEKRDTGSFSGACADRIDLNKWYVYAEIRGSDYTEYRNKGGVSMFAKEITVGNFKACVQEYSYRNEGKRD